MKRRDFLTLTATAALTAGLSVPALASNRVFYTPGLAEDAMAAGKTVVLDFWTNWCPTCAAQHRVMEELRTENPAYDRAITFITVNWDEYGTGDLSKAMKIPRRSTLVALKGETEIARIVAGTSKADIKALLDAALSAAAA